MNGLLTLPRFAAGGPIPRRVMAEALSAPSPAERASASIRLMQVVRRGQVSPQDAHAAVGQGDAGVAALLQRLAHLPPRPRVSADSFNLRAMSGPPSPALLDALIGLVRLLGEAGDLTPTDCRAMTSSGLSYAFFITLLNRAWNRRCHRIVAPVWKAIAPSLPEGARPSSGFFVVPGVLVEAVQQSVNPWGYSSQLEPDAGGTMIASCDDIPDVYVEAGGTMTATCPVSVLDHEDHAAVCGAWDNLVDELSFPLMASSQDTIPMLVGYADELMADAALACTWIEDQPQIEDASLIELGEEIGFGAESPEALDALRDYLRYRRNQSLRPRWKTTSRAMRQWRKGRAGTPIGSQVEALLALAKLLRKAPAVDRDHVLTEHSDEGVLPLTLMPSGTGLDGYFQYVIDQQWQNEGCAHLTLTRTQDAQSPSASALIDRCVLEAAVASAASAVLDPSFRRASEPEAESCDDADEDDDFI